MLYSQLTSQELRDQINVNSVTFYMHADAVWVSHNRLMKGSRGAGCGLWKAKSLKAAWW